MSILKYQLERYYSLEVGVKDLMERYTFLDTPKINFLIWQIEALKDSLGKEVEALDVDDSTD